MVCVCARVCVVSILQDFAANIVSLRLDEEEDDDDNQHHFLLLPLPSPSFPFSIRFKKCSGRSPWPQTGQLVRSWLLPTNYEMLISLFSVNFLSRVQFFNLKRKNLFQLLESVSEKIDFASEIDLMVIGRDGFVGDIAQLCFPLFVTFNKKCFELSVFTIKNFQWRKMNFLKWIINWMKLIVIWRKQNSNQYFQETRFFN